YFPKKPPVDVVGMHTLRSEPCNNNAPGGGRRRVGVRCFDVTLLERLALLRYSLPGNLSGASVDRVDDPTMNRTIFRRVAVSVQAGAESSFWIATDGAGDKHAV